MVADLMADAGKGQIDGVMYVDPQSLEALIGLTGPVTVPGTEIQLTGSNTASFFLVEQFVKLPQTPESDAALPADVPMAARGLLALRQAEAAFAQGDFAAAAAFGKLQEYGDATQQRVEDVKETLHLRAFA